MVEFCHNCGASLGPENYSGICAECRWIARNSWLLRMQREHDANRRKAVVARRIQDLDATYRRQETTEEGNMTTRHEDIAVKASAELGLEIDAESVARAERLTGTPFELSPEYIGRIAALNAAEGQTAQRDMTAAAADLVALGVDVTAASREMGIDPSLMDKRWSS